MKLSFTLCLLSFMVLSLSASAQDANPFKSIGKKAKVATLSNGRYVEVIENDSIQRVGSVLVNTHTQKIIALLDADSLYKKAADNSQQSRWYSADPLANKFAEWSPYNLTYDNPIRFVDTDGRAASPIFDIESGKFLGADNQGYSGKILFMSSAIYQGISTFGTTTISHETALAFGTTVDKMPFTQQSAIAMGNAFSDIDSKVDIKGFSMSELPNGKVSTYGAIGYYDNQNNYQIGAIGFNNNGHALDWNTLGSSPAATNKAEGTITYNLNNEFRPMISTVENVQNLFVHEAGGHWVNGFDQGTGQHYKAYEMQINHSTFSKTTPDFQQQILNALKNSKEGTW